jgi:protein phosphatase 1G
MGASLVYLDKPNKEINFDEGENEKLRYAAGDMQGWRLNMEDAHITNLEFEKDKKQCLFSVFDGHGGQEVAEYCKRHIQNTLRKTTEYKEENYAKAMVRAFLATDE